MGTGPAPPHLEQAPHHTRTTSAERNLRSHGAKRLGCHPSPYQTPEDLGVGLISSWDSELQGPSLCRTQWRGVDGGDCPHPSRGLGDSSGSALQVALAEKQV